MIPAHLDRPIVLAIQNDPSDPPLLVGEWLAHAGIEVRVIRADLGEVVPTTLAQEYDGLLAMGGGMGANDDAVAPWLPAERALLRDATQRGIPVFGICLGGQLLAAANGGVVERGPVAEIGLSWIDRTSQAEGDPVISAIAASMDIGRIPAAQWHQDHVAVLPEGATLLLTNEACRVQGYRIGTCAYGVQLHPELDGELFTQWLHYPDDASDNAGIDLEAAAGEVKARSADLVAAWAPMTAAWGELVRTHHGSRG